MFEYEMQQLRQADRIREAEEQHQVAEALRGRRGRRNAEHEAEGRVSHTHRRFRFARAA